MTLLAQTPSLRARQTSLRTCARRAERATKMQVSDCVDTALTRARQARLPSPWTGRWKSRERENATRSATELGLRAEPLGEAQKSLRRAHGERSERLKMHASDCT